MGLLVWFKNLLLRGHTGRKISRNGAPLPAAIVPTIETYYSWNFDPRENNISHLQHTLFILVLRDSILCIWETILDPRGSSFGPGSQFLASESRFWVLGVDFGPLRVTCRHLGVAFWTVSRFLVCESQFRASGSRFLGCGTRIWALVVDFRPLKVNFMYLVYELWYLGINLWPLGVNFLGLWGNGV